MRLNANLEAGIGCVLSSKTAPLLFGDPEECVEGGSDLTTHCMEIQRICRSVNSRVFESECRPECQLKSYSNRRSEGQGRFSPFGKPIEPRD